MSEGYFSPFSKEELLPQAEKLETVIRRRNLSLGIPKETNLQEKGVSLTPDAVSVLVANGHRIVFESGAGEGANYKDILYSEAGAEIVFDKKEVFSQPFILKVQPPTLEEIAFMQLDSVLISTVQPKTQKRIFFETLAKKRITALGYSYIQDDDGQLPIIRILSEIAGTASVLIASELMCTNHSGNGLLMGGVSGVRPTEVVILGAGTVGEFATRASQGMGASVRIFDNSLTRLRRIQNNMGHRLSTSFMDPKELTKALFRADVLIGAIRGKDRTPVVVSEDMVKKMKPGAIIIDVSINHGGCVETSEVTTHEKPVIRKHDVIHYAVPNITSRFPRTATKALSNFFLMYLLHISDAGGFAHLLHKEKGLREGVYMYKGRMTKKSLCNWYDFQYHDINLLIF